MRAAIVDNSSDWRDGFLFVGHHLALDFLNTRPVQNGETIELLSDFHALIRWFQAAHWLQPREAVRLQREWGELARAQRVLISVRQLREKLRKQIVNWEGGGVIQPETIKGLNELLRLHPLPSRLAISGDRLLMEASFNPQQPDDLLGPLAHSIATLFANEDPSRVRQCGACVLHFLDTSKKGTRHWCSMKLCGNRHKVAAYAARQRLH